jgi:hypothetical protein
MTNRDPVTQPCPNRDPVTVTRHRDPVTHPIGVTVTVTDPHVGGRP